MAAFFVALLIPTAVSIPLATVKVLLASVVSPFVRREAAMGDNAEAATLPPWLAALAGTLRLIERADVLDALAVPADVAALAALEVALAAFVDLLAPRQAALQREAEAAARPPVLAALARALVRPVRALLVGEAFLRPLVAVGVALAAVEVGLAALARPGFRREAAVRDDAEAAAGPVFGAAVAPAGDRAVAVGRGVARR